MSSIRVEDDVLERKILEPDPGLVKSLGTHHTIESAIADLIDNSIDASATRVLVRFDTDHGQPIGLRIVDDGRGMDGPQADEAMRLGRQREYSNQDQGHFGIGLKAASFSHADTLTLATRPASGKTHCRRLRRNDVQRDYGCDVIDPATVRDGLQAMLERIGGTTGTVVHWADTRFPQTSHAGLTHWLEETKTRLRLHLGLIYHRLLDSRRLRIDLDVFDIAQGRAGIPEPITPIDPFGHRATAIDSYPRTLTATIGRRSVDLTCHILPTKLSGPEFRLYGRDGAEFQGFYLYRSDRLLQAGGWNHVTASHKDRALARVVIDDFGAVADLIRLNPEKSGVLFTHEFQTAIAHAVHDHRGVQSTFTDYLTHAESVLTESRRRQHRRRPMAEPSKGLHEEVRRVIRAEVPLRVEEGPVEIRWNSMAPEKFFELDRAARVINLNKQYRTALTGGNTGLSDAPLVKTLMFLLTEDLFKGSVWGPRDKDLLEVWSAILAAAIRAESRYRDNGSR
ncbi:ATP-binding protein [Actinoplanes hulinensis]|uniref:ATP-binding protein n=1 Tax=Actinoplanes hulinensis TaxID=1144547 RepID=A0ABS7BEG8_9ACTN|nr:ATP-binding protein [Actinoplanes hulinensis]MBW6439257.1 ATP-binding protein [Actinoplanes hulinensis]MBW6439268.1 ATP-binding protein [Actinoplanes hulinensis]